MDEYAFSSQDFLDGPGVFLSAPEPSLSELVKRGAEGLWRSDSGAHYPLRCELDAIREKNKPLASIESSRI